MNRKVKALGASSFLCAIMAIGVFYWVKSLYYNLLRNSSSDLKRYYDTILANWKSRHGNESENPRLDELSKYLKNCYTKVSADDEYWNKWNSLDNLKKAAYFN